jgi:hypothetical protein
MAKSKGVPASSAASPFVPADKIDPCAFQIMKAAKALENGRISTPEFLVFTVDALADAGAVSRRKKIQLEQATPASEAPSEPIIP